jgi:hypothetical protein
MEVEDSSMRATKLMLECRTPHSCTFIAAAMSTKPSFGCSLHDVCFVKL